MSLYGAIDKKFIHRDVASSGEGTNNIFVVEDVAPAATADIGFCIAIALPADGSAVRVLEKIQVTAHVASIEFTAVTAGDILYLVLIPRAELGL